MGVMLCNTSHFLKSNQPVNFCFLDLEYEQAYLDSIPCSDRYERSYMHRDDVTHVAVTKTDFIITASCDGHVKFWKKMDLGIEFVKHFRLLSSVT